jgi:hypothetical protein
MTTNKISTPVVTCGHGYAGNYELRNPLQDQQYRNVEAPILSATRTLLEFDFAAEIETKYV